MLLRDLSTDSKSNREQGERNQKKTEMKVTRKQNQIKHSFTRKKNNGNKTNHRETI